MKKGAKDLRGKRPKGQMTGGANDLGAKDLGAKDRGGKSPTPIINWRQRIDTYIYLAGKTINK